MKKIAALTVLFLLSASTILAEVDPGSEQKFKTVISITYNEATLSEAAALEKQIKANHKSACKVKMRLEEISNYSGVFIGNASETMTFHTNN